MTRNEFINDINDWEELIDFCRDMNYELCDDIYSEYSRDDYINDYLENIASECGDWRSLISTLEDITTGYDYYLYESTTDWRGLDDGDFECYKETVVEWMDDRELWSEEEDDEEEECNVDPYDLSPLETEDISISELFSACSQGLKSITDADKASDEAAENSFIEFVAEFGFASTSE